MSYLICFRCVRLFIKYWIWCFWTCLLNSGSCIEYLLIVFVSIKQPIDVMMNGVSHGWNTLWSCIRGKNKSDIIVCRTLSESSDLTFAALKCPRPLKTALRQRLECVVAFQKCFTSRCFSFCHEPRGAYQQWLSTTTLIVWICLTFLVLLLVHSQFLGKDLTSEPSFTLLHAVCCCPNLALLLKTKHATKSHNLHEIIRYVFHFQPTKINI